MVLAIIVVLTLILVWFVFSPIFEKIGGFILKKVKNIFGENKGDEKNE